MRPGSWEHDNGRASPLLLAPEGMVELVTLLNGWQVAALEEAARRRGLSTGTLVRRLVQQFLSGERPAERPA
jgi:hypothetical protein